jgi:hypothetical protein
MATGMHHPLTLRGIGQARAFLHRKSIHINAQTNRGPLIGPQFGNNPCAAHTLLDAPAQAPQLSCHQRRRLMLFSTEFWVSMQVLTQFQQLRQLLR